jgi:hypothetical protein
MSYVDIIVQLRDGPHEAELIKSGAKRSWVRLRDNKKMIKVRNRQLTFRGYIADGNPGVRILGPDGNPVRATS